MSSKLQKSLTDYNSTLVKEGEILYGNLGTVIGGKVVVSVPGRASFVYVRLRTKLSELIEAFNSEVAQKYNTPVLIERKGNRYVVIGRNTETFSDWETNDPYIPQHAEQHIFDKDGGNMGGDPVWVYPYQFMPALVTPFGSRGAANVFLHSYPLHTENGWKYTGNTGTPRLTQYNPESGATLVLVTLDSQTGNPAIFATTGTFIPESVTGTSQLISYLPQVSDLRYLPDSFVRLVSGTSSIGWSNIYDVRQFLSFSPSGTSYLSINGNSGIDDFEFTGALVSVTGTTAYISITGSSGGTSDHEALTGLLGGSVNDHWHMTPSQMIGLVSGTSTALHSHAGGIGTGTAGQLVKWGALGNTLVDAALIPPASNILTLTNAAAATLALNITAGKTLTLTATDNFNLTIPATGTAALLGTANAFTTTQTITPATDVVGQIINISATADGFQVKNGATVLLGIDKLGSLYATKGSIGTAYNNFFLGKTVGNATASSANGGNFALGDTSLQSLTSGYANTVIGINSAGLTADGFENIVLGNSAFARNVGGDQNVVIGNAALYRNTNGNENVAIGNLAGYGGADNIQSYNVIIGGHSGYNLRDAVQNTMLGSYAGYSLTSGDRNIFLGMYAGWERTTESDLLIITNRQGATSELINSIVYGVMATTPAAQTLRLNAVVTTAQLVAATNTVTAAHIIRVESTGTAAAGFGGALRFDLETATADTIQSAAQIAAIWTDATNATRKASLKLSAFDTSERLGITILADGVAGITRTAAASEGAYATTAINLTLTSVHHWVKVTAACTITLPACSGLTGREYIITATVDNVIIDGNASETISGETTQTMSAYDTMQIKTDGSNWFII